MEITAVRQPGSNPEYFEDYSKLAFLYFYDQVANTTATKPVLSQIQTFRIIERSQSYTVPLLTLNGQLVNECIHTGLNKLPL